MQMDHRPSLNIFPRDSTDPASDFCNELKSPTLQSKDFMTSSHVTNSRLFPGKDRKESTGISDLQGGQRKKVLLT